MSCRVLPAGKQILLPPLAEKGVSQENYGRYTCGNSGCLVKLGVGRTFGRNCQQREERDEHTQAGDTSSGDVIVDTPNP